MCVCVCVCCHPIYSGRLGLWTYQPGSHRRKITQDFSTFLLRRMPELSSREGFSHSFSSSTVKSNFYVLRNQSFSTCRTFFFFFARKNPSSRDWLHRDSNSRPDVRRFRGYQLSHRGDRFLCCHPIYSGRQTCDLWTHQPRSHSGKVIQNFSTFLCVCIY